MRAPNPLNHGVEADDDDGNETVSEQFRISAVGADQLLQFRIQIEAKQSKKLLRIAFHSDSIRRFDAHLCVGSVISLPHSIPSFSSQLYCRALPYV